VTRQIQDQIFNSHYLKSVPVMRMLEQVEAVTGFYVYGPVCIARDAQGTGLLARLRAGAKYCYGERPNAQPARNGRKRPSNSATSSTMAPPRQASARPS
jgi:hypothetical protein